MEHVKEDVFPNHCVCATRLQSCLTLCDRMNYSPSGSSVHGDSPGKNTGMGCHALLQGIFPTQRWNPGLLHCRWILHQLSYQGSPKKGPSMCRCRSRAFRKRQGPQRKRGFPVHWEEGERLVWKLGGG